MIHSFDPSTCILLIGILSDPQADLPPLLPTAAIR